MSKSLTILGERIQERRRQLHRSAKDLARAAGVSRGHLSQIEHGQKLPSVEALVRIADALELLPAQLLAQEDQPRGLEALETLSQRWVLTAEERTLLASVCLGGRRPATPEAYLLILLAMRQACASAPSRHEIVTLPMGTAPEPNEGDPQRLEASDGAAQ